MLSQASFRAQPAIHSDATNTTRVVKKIGRATLPWTMRE
jgi:hypothetical protein